MNADRITSAANMNLALKQIYRDFAEEAAVIHRTVTLATRGDLQILTPKRTGWASKHWSIGLNRTTESEELTVDSMEGLKFGDVTFIFNNVPYIERLDNGWSLQRPSGFTHLALAKARAYLSKQYRTLSEKRIP